MKEKIQLKDLIASIQERRYTRVESIAAGGMLELYKSKSGAFTFYFRFDFSRKTTRIRLGLYDSSAPPASLKPTKKGYSLAAARYKANELAAKHQEAKAAGGLEAVIKEEKAIEEEKKAELAAAGYSLEKMYVLYAESIDLLETRRQIKSLFNKNVKLAFPEIAEKQANKVTREDVFEVLKLILDAGHKRTAEKMHSYLRAAYEKAMNVTRDVTISAEFKNFKIKHNPITDM